MKTIYRGSDGSLGFRQQQEYKLLIKVEKNLICIWELDQDGCVGDNMKTCKYASFKAFTANWRVECEDLFEEVKLGQLS